MNWDKLSDDQLAIAEKVGAAATKHGLNPDFVLPMVYAESGFKHIKNPDSNAFGVMQLIPATAKGLKVDPTDVDQNIDGGMRLLKELIADKNIGNDPYKVLAGYNAKRDSIAKFLASGNVADLPDETLQHVTRVSEHYGGELPSVLGTPPSESAGPVAVAPPVPPDTKVKDIKNPDGTSSPPQKSAKELALLGGAAGAVTGGALTGGYATYQGLQTVKNALANMAQAAQNATAPVPVPGAVPGAPTQIAPAGATPGQSAMLTDRQIQGTAFPEESGGAFSGDKRNTGRARGTGYNTLSAQEAARQREQYALYKKLGLSPDREFAALGGLGSTESGVLANRAAINDVKQAAANRAEQQAAALAAEDARQGSSVLGNISERLRPLARYFAPIAKLAGSTLGGMGAAVQGYDTAQDYAKNGLTPRNAFKGLATLGSAAAMIPSGLTQIGGALAQIPAAGFDVYDYAANRLATDPVNDYQTVPTMLPRQRRTTAVYPGAQ